MINLFDKFRRCPNCAHFSIIPSKLNPTERFKSLVMPVKAYYCDHCSYRYAEFGKFSLKNSSLLAFFIEKKLAFGISIISVILIIVASFYIPHFLNKSTKNNEDKIDSNTIDAIKNPIVITEEEPTKSTKRPETKPSKIIDKDLSDLPQTNEHIQMGEKKEAENKPPLLTKIVMREKPRFGFKWTLVDNGIQIKHLYNGPFRSAGFHVGDIINSVDGDLVQSWGLLLDIRNSVFEGKRPDAKLRVLRGDEELFFLLTKQE
jgi:hypothetical protein